MRWYELRSQHLSDEEYIDRVRKNLRIMDRFRLWIIAAYTVWIAGMLLFILPYIEQSLRWIIELQSPTSGAAWTVIGGFVSGMGLGFSVMCLFSLPMLSLIFTLMPLRTDRLLLRYYDANQQAEAAHTSGGIDGERLPSTAS
ncbi:MAG TPA: hypothetical protein VFG20_20310 [Planctomycetaceae bacterium]|nr:hypothetical protein [Planctomycetaceae bacterium]